MRLFSDMKGLAVVAGEGRVIGKVTDVMLDPDGWRVSGLVVKLDKEAAERLGRHKTFGSPTAVIRVEHIKGVSQTVVLHEGLTELASAVEETHAAH
jgi:sporulation protein YlmC with PRC-barrel domain